MYSFSVVALAFTSGVPQGMIRYVLSAPSIFVVLGGWGKRPVFDKAWILLSILLMGLLTTLFTFDFWVA
jgi:hypothetical protein